MYSARHTIAKHKGMLAGMAAVMLATGVVVPAMAQRDPAHDAARSSGQIGEKMDGYIGIVDARKRSAERRVGKDGVSTCRYRWSPFHYKKKQIFHARTQVYLLFN